jgi:hypothetical protein
MSYPNYFIKNCSAKDAKVARPKLWSKLKPAFSDLVRHCDHCNKKVYLCETDEQIKFYSSVKFCTAIADPGEVAKVVENPPSEPASITTTAAPEKSGSNVMMAIDPSTPNDRSTPNVWRRAQPPKHLEEMQHDDNPAFLRKQPEDTEDSDMPAFMRWQKQ